MVKKCTERLITLTANFTHPVVVCSYIGYNAKMADQTLRGLRTGLVESLNKAVVTDLLDDLQERKIFNTGEVEEVQEGQRTTKEKARSLLDMVLRKGPRACEGFIECLRQRDQELCSKLQL